MNFIIVDDEHPEIDYLNALLRKTIPEATVKSFSNPKDALSYLSNNKADIALLDIEMEEMDGITLAKKCKDLCHNMNIIFVTGHDQYSLEALRIYASGYLMKPVREKDIQLELQNLRHPIPVSFKKRVRIQTFGDFEIFVDNKPLHFPMKKCKECLAYLIDRKGAAIPTGAITGILWEDRPYSKTMQNNTHRVISDLLKTLKTAGVRDIIIKNRREISIDTEKVDCDYYEFLKGNVSYINTFRGEYMSNYSWAEFTLSSIQGMQMHDLSNG